MARFLYERACGVGCVLPVCVAVRPCVRSVSVTARTFRWVLRGSARCTGSSGLGDAAASFPAGGGTVREANAASRTVVLEAREAEDDRIQGIRKAIESATAHWLNNAPTAGLPHRAGEGEARGGSPCLALRQAVCR